MRTKKRPALATPDLKSAWADFYASTKEDDMEAHAAEGWKTLAKIAQESGLSVNTITHQLKMLIRQNKFEKKIVRGMTGNGVREVAIYRPSGNSGQQRCK
jgi:hypothetical protein